MLRRICGIQALALGLLLMAAGPAAALGYSLQDTIPGSGHVVKYEILGSTKSAYAVGFEAEYDGVAGVSFCGDLLHTVSVPGSYSGSPIDLGTLGAGYTTAAKMVNRWALDLGSLGSSLKNAAAGVQLAVWETIYGSDFTLLSSMNAGTQAAYDTVMGLDYGSLDVGDTVFLDVKAGSTSKQDHFFKPEDGPATPEPGAALLFGVGLAVVARSLRREAA